MPQVGLIGGGSSLTELCVAAIPAATILGLLLGLSVFSITSVQQCDTDEH